jgi:adenosylcobinamide-GDP ribazoletransferase
VVAAARVAALMARPPGLLESEARGLLAALRFLTSLPLRGPAEPAGLERALAWFPLVGLALGAVLVGLDRLLSAVFAHPLVDFLLLAALVLLTGGLHLDGLVDTADGLPAPGTSEQRLAALREPWAGPRGTAAALAALILQFAALTSLGPPAREASLLLAPALGRWAIVYAYARFPYARRTAGLSLALKRGAGRRAVAIATATILAAALLLGRPGALALVGFAWVSGLGLGLIACRRLGGMSGDVYGALEQVVETTALLLGPCLLAAR